MMSYGFFEFATSNNAPGMKGTVRCYKHHADFSHPIYPTAKMTVTITVSTVNISV